MALFVNQENTRTKLQQKIAADLAEKAKRKGQSAEEPVDGVNDSAYLEQTKNTTSLAWVWMVVIIIAVGVMVWIAAKSIL